MTRHEYILKREINLNSLHVHLSCLTRKNNTNTRIDGSSGGGVGGWHEGERVFIFYNFLELEKYRN